ncbi:MAG: toprim domain-containing protein [Deltaproteobacteria bacterium]|nr:toprim domain-containing protein [Deltaproteobacteria bacterium]
MTIERETFLNRLREGADLPRVAAQLGMKVIRRGTESTALCPFHNDHRPSLRFFQNQRGTWAYKCFACDAYGDAFDLVMKLEGTAFWPAAEWLAQFQGVPVPPRRVQGEGSPRTSLRIQGLETALAVFRSETKTEGKLSEAEAERRGFSAEIFQAHEIAAARKHKLSRHLARKNKSAGHELRELRAGFEAAGLLVRRRNRDEETQERFAFDNLTDFFWDERLLFPIRDHRGNLAGFAGRALGEASKPKYLYSKGFEKGRVIYGLDRVFADLEERRTAERSRKGKKRPWTLDLYLVEGLFDVLRLRELGFQCGAVLGNNLSAHQAELVCQVVTEVARSGGVLAIHVFFDGDAAGRRGASRALVELWKSFLRNDLASLVDVVALTTEHFPKKDPDEFLRGRTRKQANGDISGLVVPATQAILADLLDSPIVEVERQWNETAPPTQQWVLQGFLEKLPRKKWRQVFQRFRPLATSLEAESSQEVSWQNRVRSFLGVNDPEEFSELPAQTARMSAAVPTEVLEHSDEQHLVLAHQLAMASRHRREFPIDEASWERLGTGFDAIIPFYKSLLEDGQAKRLEPYLAVYLPKASGDLRLKALPCPEDLTLQQYMLNELLRTYPEDSELSEHIPAVRWQQGHLVTTGWRDGGEFGLREGAVSFAYQVDMDALEERLRAGKRTLFRPFFECWKAYIHFLSHGVTQFEEDPLYALRLDIRGFYDNLHRSIVNDAIRQPLQKALSREGFDANSMAPLFGNSHRNLASSLDETDRSADTDSNAAGDRANAIVDWLCEQSFHYPYRDPSSGKQLQSPPDRGLPQGPDLSAYLANISLFKLDQAVTEAIELLNQRRAEPTQQAASLSHTRFASAERRDKEQETRTTRTALYARYVDDLILIACQPGELEELRSLIEHKLSEIGLSLSHKTDPLPPMSRGDLRRWLTDQRSMGAEYGPVPGLDPLQLLATRGWGDSGLELDRGTALQLLHGQSLHDLEKAPQQVEDSIALARQAELRPGDEAVAAKLLWLTAASRGIEDTEPELLARQIKAKWQESNPATARELALGVEERLIEEEFQRAWPVLAWLEGLMLALRSRMDRNLKASSEEKKSLSRLRESLARKVQEGLCPALVSLDTDPKPFAHQKAAWCWALLKAAAEVVDPKDGSVGLNQMALPSHELHKSPFLFRLACSLHQLFPISDFLGPLRFQPGPNHKSNEHGLAELRYFHEAVARLSRGELDAGRDDATPLDPLQPMVSFLSNTYRASDPIATELLESIRSWLPDQEGEAPKGSEGSTTPQLLALSAFVNAAGSRTPQLLFRRSCFHSVILETHGFEGAKFLPVPQGVAYPGLLAIQEQRLIAFLFGQEDIPNRSASGPPTCLTSDFRPRELRWKTSANSGLNQPHWDAYETDLGAWRLREHAEIPLVRREDQEKVQVLTEIGAAFKALARGQQDSQGREPVPSAAHLLRRQRIDTDQGSEWSFLGFGLRQEDLGYQAFVVQKNSGSLLAEPVPASGAALWRLGVALGNLHLAYDPKLADPAHRLSAKALVLAPHQDPAVEAVVRTSLARLVGAYAPLGPLYYSPDDAPGDKLPQSISRTLNRLSAFKRAFEAKETNQTLAFALAIFFEGRIDREIIRQQELEVRQGGAALGLLKAVRHLIGVDAKLNEALPPLPSLPSWFPKRRPARAWLAIAQRLRQLPKIADQDFLEFAMAGYRLLGLQELLRAQALERWTTLPSSWKAEANWSLDLSFWGVNEGAILVDDESLTSPLDLLVDLEERFSPARLGSLERITPLGWLALLAALSGMTPNNDRRQPLPENAETKAVEGTLKELASLLAEPWQLEEEPRKKSFTHLARTLKGNSLPNQPNLRKFCEALDSLDRTQGYKVHIEESDRLDSRPRIGLDWELFSDSYGARGLPCYSLRQLRLDPRNQQENWETIDAEAAKYRLQRRASLTIREEELVGVGWLSQEMAHLAGLDKEEKSQENTLGHPTPPPVPSAEAELTPKAKSDLPPKEEPRDKAPTEEPPVQDEPSADPDSESEGIRELQLRQRAGWKTRGQSKRPNTARIAFLQWSVEESYHHPIFDTCNNLEAWNQLTEARQEEPREQKDAKCEIKGHLKKNRDLRKNLRGPRLEAGDSPRKLRSCAEHRRRKILASALEACHTFGVDLLLLPEYGIRPDTVDWLKRRLQATTQTSVWAGTYRLPPQSSQEIGRNSSFLQERRDWESCLSAVIPDLRTGGEPRILRRSKKYPAQAVNEIFNPHSDIIKPLFDQNIGRPVFDPRRFVMELICSEIFLITSPANWRFLAEALGTLMRKFRWDSKSLKKAYEDDVIQDASGLGDYLSYYSKTQFPRRSILLVPAMTRRAVDFAALGQASYLSAGITTVFCNAIGKEGIGNSCFIGHGCWDIEASKVPKSVSSQNPYHGLTPGIFRQHEEGRGSLGSKEQALVIADVDPLHSITGQPRPQSQPPALELVAHLPIIESWKKRYQPSAGNRDRASCTCGRMESAELDNSKGFKIKDLVERLEQLKDISSIKDNDPGKLAEVLRSLAHRAGHQNGGWLQKRADAYEKNHLQHPVPWPPPVAIDWLWVDLGQPGNAVTYPKIEVPPYSNAAGEISEEEE